jgi:HD-GYP domain-containing protein (c-di-GMP phosphodiesterase class II)
MTLNSTDHKAFFSVALDLIIIDRPLPYDLFVNSSSIKFKEHFVKIYPKNEILDKSTLLILKDKYFQLYLPESQRKDYLQSIIGHKGLSELKKTEIFKNKTIEHLQNLYENRNEITSEFLVTSINQCRDQVEGMLELIKDKKIEDLHSLISQLSFHDFYTYDHSVNVSMYAMSFAQKLFPQFDKKTLISIGLGGLLHDLGKMKIPTHIINKPSKLTDEEFAEIKKHPDLGMEVLNLVKNQQGAETDWKILSVIIQQHHENVNGTGYPSKLTGEQIHPSAKMLAIVDFFDAITTHRSYHEALKIPDALELMKKSIGQKLDEKFFASFAPHCGKLPINPKQQKLKLPDWFDPCHPHLVLPYESERCSINMDKTSSFGKITGDFSIKKNKK